MISNHSTGIKKVTVHAPATVANLVCGFDVLGMCLHEPHDVMHVTLLHEKKIIIESLDGFQLPTDPQHNTAGAPLIEMLDELNEDIGFHVQIQKNIKPGSGIGSSAASAAGAVVAANYLLNNRFSKQDLVRFAMAGEKIASGVKHADNVAPCIYGGVTLIRSIFPLDIVAIPSPQLFVTVIHPQIEIRTIDARQILRKEVLLKNAIKQWGNVAGLVAGLMSNNYELVGRSLEDVIIEPARKILIPGFDEVKLKCLQAGVLGGGISGSGPSVFMLSKDHSTAKRAEQVMQEVYNNLGVSYRTYITTINTNGVAVATEK